MRRFFLGIAVIAFVSCTFCALLAQDSPPGLPEGMVPYNEHVDQRVALLVEPLGKQTLEESLTMLERMGPYGWSGVRPGFSVGVDGPLSLNGRRQSAILSSRVFRKCLEEVKMLPPKEAALLINRHLDSALSAYIGACEAGESPSQISEASIYSENRADAKSIYQGFRHKLFALLHIAGSCELTDSHEMVSKVANIALEQRNWVLNVNNMLIEREMSLQEREQLLASPTLPYLGVGGDRKESYAGIGASLWNPHILSAGLLGTHPRKDSPEFTEIAKRYQEYSIVDYTALRTEYDDSFGSRVEPGEGKDYIKIRYFENSTDADVLTLLGVAAGK